MISCYVALVLGQHPAHLDFDVNVEIGKLHDLIAAQRVQHNEPLQDLHQEAEALPLDIKVTPVPELATEPIQVPIPVERIPTRRRPGLRRRKPQGSRPVLRRRPETVQEPRPTVAPVIQELAQPVANENLTFRAQTPAPASGSIQTIDYHPSFRQQVTFVDEQQRHRFAANAEAPKPLPIGPGQTHDENGLLINPRGYDGPLAHTVPAGIGGTIHTQFTPEVADFHKFLAQAHADHLVQVAGLERRQIFQ
ncbi:unnamed protein product [Meganyctiphanes norvegica]|uniref:Uncharacterized protein n=1 Tax=Meganyctiphanes norvegica TaxID=48144 RepID=A0AAV2S4R9_MEGNR